MIADDVEKSCWATAVREEGMDESGQDPRRGLLRRFLEGARTGVWLREGLQLLRTYHFQDLLPTQHRSFLNV